MIIRINPDTIHNLQTVATYTTTDEPIRMGKDDLEMVVRCNGDTIARGQGAIDFWGVLISLVNVDLVKTATIEYETQIPKQFLSRFDFNESKKR